MSCSHKIPHICGGSPLYINVEPCQNDITFEGVDDISVIQGTEVDLEQGVHAYDANGNELQFTFNPTSIAKCDVGVHTITYKATGEGSELLAYVPCGKNALTLRKCGLITKTVTRKITVTQADAPTITGLDTINVNAGEEFGELSGVVATSAIGQQLPVSARIIEDLVRDLTTHR